MVIVNIEYGIEHQVDTTECQCGLLAALKKNIKDRKITLFSGIDTKQPYRS